MRRKKKTDPFYKRIPKLISYHAGDSIAAVTRHDRKVGKPGTIITVIHATMRSFPMHLWLPYYTE